MQSGPKNTTWVKVSGAARKLLWHAAKKNATQQKADFRGDRAQTEASGEGLFLCHMLLSCQCFEM